MLLERLARSVEGALACHYPFIAFFLCLRPQGSTCCSVVQVFIRERLNGYYGVSVFTMANTIASLPFIFLIAVVSTVSATLAATAC